MALCLLPVAVSASIKATADQIRTARQAVAEKRAQAANRVLKQEYASDRLIVRLRPGKDSKLESLTASVGGKIRRKIGKSDYYSIKLPKGADLNKVLARFRSNPNVEYAGRDQTLRIAMAPPNDPVYTYGDDLNGIPQWGLKNTIGTTGADIHALQAWDITTGSPNVVVAVIDTGIDYTHPDLEEKIWGNPGEIPDNDVDDDNNGFVDDWMGWNFAYDTNDPDDDFEVYGLRFYHGTMVSGIIAASTNNWDGMAGVSWGGMILPLKAADYEGKAYCSDLAAAIDYAVSLGVKVINISMAGLIGDPNDPDTDNEPLVADAVERAWNAGTICVCASGNENTDAAMFPASYEHALSVGATNESDERCGPGDWGPGGGSNWGDSLDVMAPGNNIVSTSRLWSDFGVTESPYDTESGTSFACPFVAGVASLIWSKYPNLTPAQVVYQIEHTADNVGAPGWDIYTGWGRVNAYRALTEFPTSLSSVAGVKTAAQGSLVELQGLILTTDSDSFGNQLYVQDADRASGVLLSFNNGAPENLFVGDEVTVNGRVDKFAGEVALIDPTVKRTHTATLESIPKPLGMNNRTAGGAGFGRQASVVNHYAFPRKYAIGRNNIGLLVKLWGKVTAAGSNYFYINDGSGLYDDTDNLGVRVVFDPDKIERPSTGQKVAITGISSCELVTGSATILRRILKPRTQDDIKLLHN
jgi:subtilisin family serine protease